MTSSTTLPTAPLGSTGLDVSRLALGTMTFGVETAEDKAFAQLDAYAAAGILRGVAPRTGARGRRWAGAG